MRRPTTARHGRTSPRPRSRIRAVKFRHRAGTEPLRTFVPQQVAEMPLQREVRHVVREAADVEGSLRRAVAPHGQCGPVETEMTRSSRDGLAGLCGRAGRALPGVPAVAGRGGSDSERATESGMAAADGSNATVHALTNS